MPPLRLELAMARDSSGRERMAANQVSHSRTWVLKRNAPDPGSWMT